MSKELVIIEDDISILDSLKSFIEAKTDFKIIGIHQSVESFMASPIQDSAVIILLDIGLPGMSGLEGIPSIHKAYPRSSIVMLTTYEESEMIFEALSLGACSYISKKTSLPKIIEGIQIIANGGAYMSPSIARKVISYFNNQPKKSKYELTERQKEIVNFLVEGKKYREIASLCNISLNTVRTHIKNIYELLQVNNKATLIMKFNKGEIK